MSQLKEILGYNKNQKQIVKLTNVNISLPPLKLLHEITFVDHEGKAYVYKLLESNPEPAEDTTENTIGCENLSVDLNDIKDIFIILTDDQRDIVMHIYYMYKNNKKLVKHNVYGELCEENPKIILQGPAGTGKSTIINFIEKLITWEMNKSTGSSQKMKVLKCAFTGKAAANIDGFTLNYMFSIPIYKTRSLAKKKLNSKKEVLEDCIFFICDEISMVGERLMSSVNMRLQQIFETDKLYGDRFVLLVGDLYQIDPVRQQPLYPNSELWTCCEFYELTKIIRQQDENFIKALNNFRDSNMTQEDMDLLRSREIQNIDEVPDKAIHLFYLNDRVDDYNNLKLDKSNEEEEIVNAIEDGDNWMPANLRVKIGMRYMITYNMDVGDYLANGTTGIVRGFDYDENGGVSTIWMEFHSMEIGKKIKTKYFKKHEKPGFENWVPIQRSVIVVKFKSNPKVSQKVGNMFPLKAAEAITVHKSQGQTYHDGVCIHITTDQYDKLRTDKSLLYVALTRVKRLEDLYIMGNLKFVNTHSKKFIRTETELSRLRTEKQLKIAYETFQDNSDDVLIFLNTGLTFNEYYEFITTDKWYKNGSILIFIETNTIESDNIKIPNFDIVFRSDHETVLRSGGGIRCYKKANKSVEVISSIADDENKINLTLFLYEKYLYIITGVKGNLSDDDFKLAINKFISEYIRGGNCIIFIGNTNNVPGTNHYLDNIISDFNLRQNTPSDILTINDQSQRDILLTHNFDIPPNQVGCYEYIPSFHKPIYVKLPRVPVNNNNQSETSPNNLIEPPVAQENNMEVE